MMLGLIEKAAVKVLRKKSAVKHPSTSPKIDYDPADGKRGNQSFISFDDSRLFCFKGC